MTSPSPRPAVVMLVLAVASTGVLAGCSASSNVASSSTQAATSAVSTLSAVPGTTAGASTASTVSGAITVSAAASLTGSFTTLGADFKALHPDVTVTFNFGASDVLATQITQGAPVDVFAAASPKTMATVVTAKDAVGPVDFASNTLEIATPPKNPKSITSVRDLAKSGVKLALCEPTVPCGATATKMFAADKLTVHPVTLEADVKSTLAKVEQGEVDAGVVYVTDVKAAGAKVHGVVIPTAQNVTTQYPIAPLVHAKNAATAKAFVAFVNSTHGRAVLQAAGFAKP